MVNDERPELAARNEAFADTLRKRAVRLWHDDVRPPPDDTWVWAQNNTAALTLLRAGVVAEASLDHDLGADPGEGLFARGTGRETGLDLARAIEDENIAPPLVTIHSWNPAGAAAMARALEGTGCELHVVPYELPRA